MGFVSPPKTYVVGQQDLWVLVYFCVGSLVHCVGATDGTLWMWGQNMHGGLGDGTYKDKKRPVRVTVPGCSTITDIALGLSHSAALCAGMYVPRRVLLCRSVLPPTCSALRHGSMTRTDMYCLGLRDEGIGAACPRIKNDSASGRRKPVHSTQCRV